MISVASFETPFTSVELSPFDERRLAVVTCENFGASGEGQVHILELDAVESTQLNEVVSFTNSSGGLSDCSWSEVNQNQIITASTDGSVSLWDVSGSDDDPLCRWMDHSMAVVSVDWNIIEKTTFLSASLDGTIKLWRPDMFDPLTTFSTNNLPLNNVIWSPHHPEAFATSLVDGCIRLWDTRQANQTVTIAAHNDEALSVDYDKFSEHLIVSAGADRSIRTWDLRFPSAPVNILVGHSYIVKRAKCHPQIPFVIGSVSHDMSVRVWDSKPLPGLTKPEYEANNLPSQNESGIDRPTKPSHQHNDHDAGNINYGGRGDNGGQHLGCVSHGDFATGFDFSLFAAERLATCGWDRKVIVWDINLNYLVDKKKSRSLNSP